MFPDFFVPAFKIVEDSWKFGLLLLYILWDDWLIFMISGSNEQLQQQLEYTLLKPDCHSWWISKIQSGREDTLEERYAIKLCFKLGENATEAYGNLQTAFGPSCGPQKFFICMLVWVCGFYDISTFVGFLMTNPFLNKEFYFKQFKEFSISIQFHRQKYFYFKLFSFVKQF